MERAMGIEPTSEAWEAPILPLNYARSLFPIVRRTLLFVQRFRRFEQLRVCRAPLSWPQHCIQARLIGTTVRTGPYTAVRDGYASSHPPNSGDRAI
jgi:hypothetical protein